MKKSKKKNNENKNSQNVKKEILSKINNFFKEYKRNLENKDFLIMYQNNEEQKKIFLRFLKENFLHLTGINRSIPSFDFYKKLEKRTLKADDITLGKFTEKKLQVCNEMIRIFKENSKIGTYDPNNSYQKNLSIDKGMALTIPNSDMVLGIRFIGDRYTVPVSLLQQKLENISQKDTITDIICMFEKNVIEEQYNKIIYNTVDVKNLLQENKELEKLLTVDLLKEIFPKEENLEQNKEIEVVDKNEIIQPSSLKKEKVKREKRSRIRIKSNER